MESQSHTPAPTPASSLRLNQVTVPTTDLARSIEFCLFHAGVNRTDPPWRLAGSR